MKAIKMMAILAVIVMSLSAMTCFAGSDATEDIEYDNEDTTEFELKKGSTLEAGAYYYEHLIIHHDFTLTVVDSKKCPGVHHVSFHIYAKEDKKTVITFVDSAGKEKDITLAKFTNLRITNGFECNSTADGINLKGELAIGSYSIGEVFTWLDVISDEDGINIKQTKSGENSYETSIKGVSKLSIRNEEKGEKRWDVLSALNIVDFSGTLKTSIDARLLFEEVINASKLWIGQDKAKVNDWIVSISKILNNIDSFDFDGTYSSRYGNIPFEGTLTNESKTGIPWYLDLEVTDNAGEVIEKVGLNITESFLRNAFITTDSIDKVFVLLGCIDCADINFDSIVVDNGEIYIGFYGLNLSVDDGVFTLKTDMITLDTHKGETSKFKKFSAEGTKIVFELKDAKSTDEIEVDDIVKVLNHLKNASIGVDALYGSITDITTEKQNGIKVKLDLTFLGIGAYIDIDNSINKPVVTIRTHNNTTGEWNGGIRLDGEIEFLGSTIELSSAYAVLNAEAVFKFGGAGHLAMAIKKLFDGDVIHFIRPISSAAVNELTLATASEELVSIKEMLIDFERKFDASREVTDTLTTILFKQDSYLLDWVSVEAGFQLTLDRSTVTNITKIGIYGVANATKTIRDSISDAIVEAYSNDTFEYIINGNIYIDDMPMISMDRFGRLIIDFTMLPMVNTIEMFVKEKIRVTDTKVAASYDRDTLYVHYFKSGKDIKIEYESLLGYDYSISHMISKDFCKAQYKSTKMVKIDYNSTSYFAPEGTPISSVIPVPEGADIGKKFDHWEYDGKRVEVFSKELDEKTLTAVYTTKGKLTYTLVYDATPGTTTQVSVEYGSGYTAIEPSATGWDFKCWNTNKDGSGVSYNAGDDVSRLTSANGGKVVLYAQWTNMIALKDIYGQNIDEIIVEYGKKYGSGLDLISSTVVNFKCWCIEGTETVVTSSDKVNSPANLVAKIVEAPVGSHVVTVVVADKVVKGPTVYREGITFGSVLEGIEVPEIEGYEFVGWYTAHDSRAVIMNDVILYDLKIVTLYIAKEYDVTVSGVSIGKQKYDSVFNIPAAPSKEGYEFLHWKVVSNGNTNYLEEGSSIVVRDDVELTPVFGKCETLKVSVTGGTGTAVVTVNGVPKTVDAAGGYAEFKDAYGAQYVSVVYDGKEVYCKTAFIDGKDRSGVKEVEVDLSKDVKTSVIVEEDAKGTGVMPVEGLDQAGTVTGKVEYTLVVTVTDSEFGRKVSEALGKDYSITESVGLSIYQTADGKTTVLSTTAEKQIIYIEITQQVLSQLSMGGYDLGDIVVYRSHGNDVEQIPYGSASTTGECYYFSADKKYVVLNVDKFSDYGIAVPNNRMVYVDYTTGGIAYADTKTAEKGDTVTLTAEAMEGYLFLGWYSNDVTIVDGKFTMPDKNVSVYASFVKIPEPETYNVNVEQTEGGTIGADKTRDIAAGETVTLYYSADPGYKFVRWEASGVTITGNSFVMPANDVTVKAVFDKIPVVYYNVNVDCTAGGTASADKSKAAAGETVTLTYKAKDGYHFVRWDSSDVTVSGNSFTMPAKDVAVKAVFEEDPEVYHTVTLEFNNGTESVSFQVEDGKTFSEPTAPSRSGYEFAGWYANKGLTVKYDFSKPVTSDVTIYAKWDAVQPAPEKKDNTMTYVAVAAVVVIALLAVAGFVFYKKKNV